MIDSIWREIVIFSVALTLPTYFVRVIDKIPSLFKRIRCSYRLHWWWKTHHCAQCRRWFKWEVHIKQSTCRSWCNDCLAESLPERQSSYSDVGPEQPEQ